VEVIAIADDATGALETGAQFAAAAVETTVTFGRGAFEERTAIVADTESRHVSPPLACRRVVRIAARARVAGVRHVYKKTDSTLRGNIAAEFRALLRVFAGWPLVYVPAYPKLARTVTDGVLHVGGKPLSETEFAADRRNPVSESSIPRLLRELAGEGIAVAPAGADLESLDARVIVCDGDSDRDLERTAAALSRCEGPRIVAGTGGFAGHWARSISVTRAFRPPGAGRARRILVASGSLHPASLAQIGRAARAGLRVQTLTADPRDERSAVKALSEETWSALAVSPEGQGDPAGIAAKMGRIVRRTVEAADTDALVVFGGDTLFAILNALGVKSLEPAGEVLPGVPVSTIRLPGRTIRLVTKAGGFGEPDILQIIRRHLENPR
jgi:uncharacterized protein YgbK (DUF1537 family)